jgi:hypothetical protein
VLAFVVALSAAPSNVPSFILFFIPFSWGIFNLTLAQMKVHEGGLSYRRFLKWRELLYEDIRECRSSILPATGYVRLNRFLWPWGKLYFVNLRHARGESEQRLTDVINACRTDFRDDISIHNEGELRRQAGNLGKLSVAAVLAGVAYSVVLSYVLPPLPPEDSLSGFPPWLAILVRIERAAMQWPGVLVVCTIIIIVLRMRVRDRSWKRWVLCWALGALVTWAALGHFRS